jgi:hypothetical protein
MMKTWTSAALMTATVALSGAIASFGATAASLPSQKATSGKQDKATDISARSRHHHHSHRRHINGGHRGYGAGYAPPYQRSYYLQPAYSGNSYGYGGYGGYQPSYLGNSYYGSSFGGFGRSYGFGGGFGHGHRGFGHGGGHHGGHSGHGGGGHGGHGGHGHGHR